MHIPQMGFGQGPVSLLPATGRKVTPSKTAQANGTTAQVMTPQKGPPLRTIPAQFMLSSHILKG